MVKVKFVVVVMVAVTESVAVNVIVYVPLGGFDAVELELPPPPPQAVRAIPTAPSAIMQARPRNLREPRATMPASSKPAKAMPAGRDFDPGLGPSFRSALPEPLNDLNARLPCPFITAPHSVALVSMLTVVVTAAVPGTATVPPLAVEVAKPEQAFVRPALVVDKVRLTVPV